MERSWQEDRITKLPDMLRMHILSFLSRKYAIRTGALSSQWKDLWKFRFSHCTTLNFNGSFAENKSSAELVTSISKCMEKQGKKKLEIFNLYFYAGKLYPDKVTAWIKQAVLNGMEVSDLDFSQGKIGRFPGRLSGRRRKYELKASIFKRNSLSCLCLRYCRLSRCFTFKHFHSLEVLHLHAVNINDSMLKKLVMNCKSLKRLDLRECVALQYVRISATDLVLKSLVMVCCWHIQLIELSAQFLESFHFIGGSPSLYLLNTPSGLVDVVMISGGVESFNQPRDCLNVILGINAVEVLTLCSKGLQFFFGLGFSSCRLPRLRELQVILGESGDEPMEIFKFLGKCILPNLERLFIQLSKSYEEPHWYSILPAVIQLAAIEQQNFGKLKIVKLSGFKKHSKEMTFLSYLFQYAVALEQLVLVIPHDHHLDLCNNSALFSLVREISAMPKASSEVQVHWTCSSHDDETHCPTHNSLPVFTATQDA
ncbi:RNI-like protein [Dioscorea alata]|uniref:RNI-like protein n=1 Tax=Dioscorea alata TaxID=55571 RepID=A0ACB7VMY0_DIOAL|nr:RNI-like protein [Dioscorea alata]